MKVALISPDNQRFEAELVRYFQNVNDKYLIYYKNEKDANNLVTLYVTTVVSDNGIKIGENITDANEWSLIKNFIEKTVNENRDNRPLTIKDVNPTEINDLKINASKPFKLKEADMQMFSKNQESFEIVQQMLERVNTAIPVPPETTEFVTEEDDVPEVAAYTEPAPQTNIPLEEKTEINDSIVAPSLDDTVPASEIDFKSLYEREQKKNTDLESELEELLKENALYKEKMDKLKELIS
ncbi:MAG: hypothetical protein PHD02_05025 [Bacilli bacterium]|nr:hypothetical protein [Bacilli bacterium]